MAKFTYGSTSSSLFYLYFTSFSVSSGSVLSTRYRSNISCPFLYGSEMGAMSGDYIALSANCPTRYLLIVNTASSSFSVKLFSGAALLENFNKTIQKFLNEAYTSSMFNGDEEWSLPLMVNDFLHYCNSKRVHSTTKMILREILFNFKRKSIVEQVIMNTENSRKAFLQEIDFEVGDSVLLTSWMTELPNKRIRLFKKEKPMKGIKGETRNS